MALYYQRPAYLAVYFAIPLIIIRYICRRFDARFIKLYFYSPLLFLTNVMRHSTASYAKIMISEDAKNICLSVIDNDGGRGFDTSSRKKTLGLIGHRERAESLNGKLNIESAVGKGTVVKAKTVILKLKI